MQASNNDGNPSDQQANDKSGSDSKFGLQAPVCVLLVDDQPMIGEAVRRILASEQDINYHHCADPAKVFDMIAQVKPTVILQDLVMPNVNGLELLKEYRARPETANIPVIVLSTREEPKVKAIATSMGANDYLVKLPDRIELIARILYHSKNYINQLKLNNDKAV